MSQHSTWTVSRGAFTAPLELSYPYSRTVGTTLSRFFTSMMEGRLEGTRGSDGKVYVPPAEFDPRTGETLSNWVPVADTGLVVSWTWQDQPLPGQPLSEPFAWALIVLDGADVPILHAVHVDSVRKMATGLRVRARWSAERSGGIGDITCFDVDESESGHE